MCKCPQKPFVRVDSPSYVTHHSITVHVSPPSTPQYTYKFPHLSTTHIHFPYRQGDPTPAPHIQEKATRLETLTSRFCAERLNDEYAGLCRKLIAKMSRKRKVPFLTGKEEVWAAAVIRTIGSINFLFDTKSKPHVQAKEISEYFGVSSGTVSYRARKIREMFKLTYWDDEFSTERSRKNDPMPMLAAMTLGLPPELVAAMRAVPPEEKGVGVDTRGIQSLLDTWGEEPESDSDVDEDENGGSEDDYEKFKEERNRIQEDTAMKGNLYTDEGREVKRSEIPVPKLCLSCRRNDEREISCDLTRMEQMKEVR